MHKLWFALPLMLSASCADARNRPVGLDQVPPGSVCTQSDALKSFIGKPATTELGAQMMAASRSRTLRWVPEGGMITMDFSASRLTVQLDGQSRVQSARCG